MATHSTPSSARAPPRSKSGKTTEGQSRQAKSLAPRSWPASRTPRPSARQGRALAGPMPPARSPEGWLAGQIATISLPDRARAQATQRGRPTHFPPRARRGLGRRPTAEAMILGGQRPGQPDLVAEQPARPPRGASGLITRRAMLAHFTDKPGGWIGPTSSASSGSTSARPSASGALRFEALTKLRWRKNVNWSRDSKRSVARRLIAGLEQKSVLAKELDESDRKRAETGLSDDAELRRLRRYEADLQRRLRWMVQMLQGANDKQQPPPSSPRPEPGRNQARRRPRPHQPPGQVAPPR